MLHSAKSRLVRVGSSCSPARPAGKARPLPSPPQRPAATSRRCVGRSLPAISERRHPPLRAPPAAKSVAFVCNLTKLSAANTRHTGAAEIPTPFSSETRRERENLELTKTSSLTSSPIGNHGGGILTNTPSFVPEWRGELVDINIAHRNIRFLLSLQLVGECIPK